MNKLSIYNFDRYQKQDFADFKKMHQSLLTFIDDEQSTLASIKIFFKRLEHGFSALFSRGNMPLWLNNKEIIHILGSEFDVLDRLPAAIQKASTIGKENLSSYEQHTIQDVLLATAYLVHERLRGVCHLREDVSLLELYIKWRSKNLL